MKRSVPFKPRRGPAAALLLAASLNLAGCLGTAGVATPSPERAMAGMATVLDLQWRELGARTQGLADTITGACQAPDSAGLARARAAWDEARRAWMEAQLYEIGPMSRQHLKAQLGWWPVNEQRIEALIGGAEPLEVDFLLRQGSTVKGLYALEYLLWRQDGDEALLLQGLAPAGRRCAYAAAASEAMAKAWQRADEAWRDDPTAAQGSRPTAPGEPVTPLRQFPDQQAALNALVNRMVFVSQELDGTLGRALGKRAGGRVQPEALMGRLSASSTRSLLDGLCGLRTVWAGRRVAPCLAAEPESDEAQAAGLAALTRQRSPEAATGIDQALDQAAAAVQALPEPLAPLLEREAARVETGFEGLKALQRALATQLVGALGVNLTFNANDGD